MLKYYSLNISKLRTFSSITISPFKTDLRVLAVEVLDLVFTKDT